MNNTTQPMAGDLPSSKQLFRSTLLALALATIILLVFVLPAEYAIDPTGIGRKLGLAEMGEIKTQLAEEAIADAVKDRSTASLPLTKSTHLSNSEYHCNWRDTLRVELPPGKGTEIKLTMNAGEKAYFTWLAQGGTVNYDMHGDGGKEGQAISYEKGRDTSSMQGELTAGFNGHHGWYWRNRGTTNVTIIISTRGEYAEIKQMM
jgi:hypothetical protein